MTVSISPVFNIPQFEDNNGSLLNGGKIYQYEAGSISIQQTTYTGIDGLVANANPVILDSAGRLNTAFWLTNGLLYNLVLTDANDNVLQNFDNVSGVIIPITTGGGNGISVWNLETDVPAYISGTQFLIPNNHTTDFAVGNRVKAACSSGDVFGTVTIVSFSSPNTYVTLALDSLTLDSGLSAVSWSSLIADGRTVDAGGVSYTSALAYSNPKTVGGQIKAIVAADVITNGRIDDTYQVWNTSGSGANTPYAIAVDPAITTYTVGQIFTVKFGSSSAGSPTMNVNGIGALPLKMYDYTGALQTAVAIVGNISQIAYDGTYWIYLDQLPPTPFTTGAIPHGQQVFTTTGSTFIPGTGVTNVNVLCVGGGGAGGWWVSYYSGGESGTWTWASGGNGGAGGSAFKNITVVPLTSYGITIGTAGAVVVNSTGGNGTSTVFGPSLVVATGGNGGQYPPGVFTQGADGTPGSDTSGAYGIYGAGFSASGVTKGTGGAAGLALDNGWTRDPTNGTPGLVVITW